MREFLIESKLEKKLFKLVKKDKVLYMSVMNKFDEILNSIDINHYKNLRKPMHAFKRVHVRSSFVLIFKCVNDKIIFYDLDHHDKIYQ